MKYYAIPLLLVLSIASLSGQNYAQEIKSFQTGKTTVAQVAWWGTPHHGDSRAILQKALNSGATKVIINKFDTPWLIGAALKIPSNLEVVFENGAEIKAMPGKFTGLNDSLITIHGQKNVILRGTGFLTMNKKAYQNPKLYRRSEWRNALEIRNSSQVKISDLTIRDSGGDGIYLNKVKDVVIDSVKCLNHHRQGISVISAVNLLIKNSEFSHTCGTPPMAGIDFEPNNYREKMINCVVDNCQFNDNSGAGILFAFTLFNRQTDPISISIRNCTMKNNRWGIKTANLQTGSRGNVSIENSKIMGSKENSLLAAGLSTSGYNLNLKNCILDNSTATEKAAIILKSFGIPGALGNLHLTNVKVIDSRPDSKSFHYDEWQFHALKNLSGLIRHSSGQKYDLATAVSYSENNPPLKNAQINLTHLQPQLHQAAIPPQKELPFMLRASRKPLVFVQYAAKGQNITLNTRLKKITRTPVQIPVEIYCPSGKLLKKQVLTAAGTGSQIKFTAPETGTYQIKFRSGHGIRFFSNHPGNGILASDRIQLFTTRQVAVMYFLVPAKVNEIQLGINGSDPNEWVHAELCNPAGQVVSRGKKILQQQVLVGIKANTTQSEIWSLRIPRAIEDYELVILGECIPIFSSTPDGLFKIQK